MKKMSILFLICFILTSCNQINRSEKEEEKTEVKAVKTPGQIEQYKIKTYRETQDLYEKHCLSALLAGIDSAKKYTNKDFVDYNFDFVDSLTSSEVKLSIGNFFTENQKHLIIKRGVVDAYYVNVYKVENNKLTPVLKHVQDGHSFIKDTIFDVNGDGALDFSVHSYSSSGCCRRNVYTVFLNKRKSGEFISEVYFMNPTFSPNEKIIRGVEYGYQSGLYKYKWNGFKIDSVEFIVNNYLDSNNISYFISNNKDGLYDSLNRKIIKQIPKEYLKINDLDWFLNF